MIIRSPSRPSQREGHQRTAQIIEDSSNLFGFALLLMWKNKMFGFVLKHRSLPLGEGEGGRGRIEFQKRGLPLNDH
jgi:hypothetical protein